MISIKAFGICLLGPLALISAMACSSRGVATEVNTLSDTKAAILGSAYRSERQDFPGGECITGDTQSAGVATSSFSFQNSLSESEAEKQLEIEAGGRAQFGIAKVSMSAKFAQNSKSSTYSVSSVWMSDYRLPDTVQSEADRYHA